MDTTETVVSQYVIYRKPLDFPEGYAVRSWDINRGATKPAPHPIACYCWSLDVAREQVPVGYVNIGRMEEDEPQIVEVWT